MLRNLAVTRPNQLWTPNITYVPMARGFGYVVAFVDRFSRRVLVWGVSITLGADVCVEALEEALARFLKHEICNTPIRAADYGKPPKHSQFPLGTSGNKS